MKNHYHLKFSSLLFLSVITFQSCSLSGTKKNILPELSGNEALFENFVYAGNDDFYNNNPLPDDESFYNPILPGWYSDPSVCRNGDDYFLVTSTFSYFPGVPIFHSQDLINWKQIGHVLDRPSQLTNMDGQGINGGIYAPAIEYNPHNETYYMITTNVGVGNFYVKTKDPFGPWSDPIILPNTGGIDPSIFFDDDGRAYIVNNDVAPGEPEYQGHCTIRIQEFDVENDCMKGPRKILVDKGSRPENKPIWIEGPHLYKINGKYLLMAAEGGTEEGHSEVIFSSDSPMGEYKPWSGNPILTQRHLDKDRENPITCTGHADLIQTKEGDWWAFFLACRPINNSFENLGRETFLMPVRWSEDGFPYITKENEEVSLINKRPGIKIAEEPTFGNFIVKDDFSKASLDMQWLTLRKPAEDSYCLNKQPGFVSLKCTDIKSTDLNAPAFISRRIQHHKFEASTKMYFNPEDENKAAGILIFKDEHHQYFMGVNKKNDANYIFIDQIGAENKTLSSVKIETENNAFNLKVVSTGKTFDFFYASENGEWVKFISDVDANYLSTNNAGGFTGTCIGMYAVDCYN